MRKLLVIFLLVAEIVHGQGPASVGAPFTIPNYYGAPSSNPQLTVITPFDSTSGGYLHPAIIVAFGASEVGNYNFTSNTISYFAQNNNYTLRVRDTVRHIWVTYYVIVCYKPNSAQGDNDGDFNMKYFKNAYRYATTTMSGKIDPSRIYLMGLSLSGGGAADIVRDSVSWCSKFAGVAICDAVIGKFYVDNQSDIFNNINTSGLHVRFFWGNSDTQSNSPVFRDKMKFYYGGTSGNTTRPQLMMINGASHGGGWLVANDTAHNSFSNDATYTPSGTNNPNTLEWFLNYTSSAPIVNQPPVSVPGSPQTITLPTSSVTLNGSGSYDPDGRPLSAYLWAPVSGPNSPTITSPTSAITTVTGLIQGSYVFRLYVTDDSSATTSNTVAVTVNPMPPPALVQARIFMHYGALYAGYDRNSPKGFYDSQNGGKFNANPEGGVTTDTTSSSNPANGWRNSPGSPAKMYDHYGFGKINKTVAYYVRDSVNSRCRVILDLVGAKNVWDTAKKFTITKITGLSAEATTGTKIYFYNYSKIMAKPLAGRSMYEARPDSLMTPFAILSTTGNLVYTSTTCLDSMRYVMMVITGTPTQHIAQFNEMFFYGTGYNFDTSLTSYKDSIRSIYYTGTLASHKDQAHTFGKVIGDNWFEGMGPLTRRTMGPIRLYTADSYGDTALTASMPTVFKYYPAGFADFNNTIIATIKAEGHRLWVTGQGARAYNGSQGVAAAVDTIGGDPESGFAMYKATSSLAKNYAKVWGRNSSGTNAFSTHPANGQNLFTDMEVGNESKLHGYSELADFFRIKATYDSIKSVDPTMKVIWPGMVEWAVDDIRTAWFYTQVYTTDKIFPADMLNGHKYLGSRDSLKAFLQLSEQDSSTSVPPEWAISSKLGYLRWMDSLKRSVEAYVPGLEFGLTETGGSKWGHRGTVAAGTVGYYDLYATPPVGSKDSVQQLADQLERQEVFSLFTPLDVVNVYSTTNQAGGNTNFPDQFYAMGRGGARSAVTFEVQMNQAGWWSRHSRRNRIANWYADTVLVDGGRTGVWTMRLKNYLSTDSVCIIRHYGSYNGTANTLTTNLPGIVGNVEEFTSSYTDSIGNKTTLTPSSGAVTRPVSEKMTYYFYNTSGSVPSCVTNLATTLITNNTATLNWNAASGATSYKVYLYLTSGSPPGSPTYTTTNTTLPVSGLAAGFSYIYFVTPVNAIGDAVGCSSNTSAFTTLANIPGRYQTMRIRRK